MPDDTDALIATLASRQHGTFSSAQLRALGLTRGLVQSRVRRGRWERVLPGTFRISGSPTTWRQDLWITLHEAGATAAVATRSAAALVGLRSFAEGPREVTKVGRRNHVLTTGVLHESTLLPAEHLVTVDGFPCTSVARTIFDLAAVESERRVVRALDDAVLLGLTTPADVEAVLELLAGRGRTGTRMIRQVLATRLDRSYTPTESGLEQRMLWLLAQAGLPTPDRQVEVFDERGLIGRVDLAYRHQRIVIELDGRRFHAGPSDAAADEERDRRLRAVGWAVVRATGDELWLRPTAPVGRVRRWLSMSAPSPATPTPRSSGGSASPGRVLTGRTLV